VKVVGRRRGGGKRDGNEYEHEDQEVESERAKTGGESAGEEAGVGGNRGCAMRSVAEVVVRCVSEVVMRDL
jgi:hypothetical protein